MAEGWINSVTYTVLAIPNFIVGYNHVISYVAGGWTGLEYNKYSLLTGYLWTGRFDAKASSGN